MRFGISIAMFGLACMFVPVETQDTFAIHHLGSTSTQVEMQVNFTYVDGSANGSSTLTLKRNSITLAAETFVQDYVDRVYFSAFVDTGGYMGYTGSGLNPGTTYAYSVHLTFNGAAEDTLDICTAPNPLSSLNYYPVDENSVTVYFQPDLEYPGSESFDVYVDGSLESTVSAPDKEYTVTGLSAYTLYAIEVYPKEVGCYPADSAASSVSGSASTINAYSAPAAPVLELETQNQTCIAFGSDLPHLGEPGITYSLYRDGIFVKDVTGNGTDCGLSAGTQYSYTVKVSSTTNGVSKFGSPVLDCTAPSTAVELVGNLPTDQSVSLSWSSGGGHVTLYHVTDDAGVNDAYLDNTVATSYTLADLEPAETYTVTVTSILECPSTSVNKTDPVTASIVLYTAPRMPNVVVSNIDLGQGKTNELFITLTQNSTNQNHDDVTYNLYRVTEMGMALVYEDYGPFTSGQAFLNDSKLEPAAYYQYQAVAIYQGYESMVSDPVGICTYPEAVTNLNMVPFFTDYVTLSWGAPATGANPPTAYQLILNGNDSLNTSEFSINVTGSFVSQKDIISFSVAAVIECADGMLYTGAFSTVYGYMAPAPPQIVSAVSVGTTVIELYVTLNLSFDQGESGSFLITRNGHFIQSDAILTNSIQDVDLDPGTQYEYVAYAIQRGIRSRASEPVRVCTKPEPPSKISYSPSVWNPGTYVIHFEPPIAGFYEGYYVTVDVDLYSERLPQFPYDFFPLSITDPVANYVLNLQSYMKCDMTLDPTSVFLHSDKVSAIIFAEPASPTLTGTPVNSTAVQITFEETDPGFTYRIRMEGPLGLEELAKDSLNVKVIPNLEPGTEYTFEGSIYKNEVSSPGTEIVVFTNPPDLLDLKVTDVGEDMIEVSWVESLGVFDDVGFVVNDAAVVWVAGATSPHQVTSLTPDTSYMIRASTRVVTPGGSVGPHQVSNSIEITARTSMLKPLIEISPGHMPGSMTIDFVDGKNPVERNVYRVDPYGLVQQNEDVPDPFYDSGLEMGKEYQYYASYVGSNGAESEYSDPVVMCTNPEMPVSLVLSTSDPAAGTFVVTWGEPVNPPTDYNVFIGETETHSAVAATSQDISASLSGNAKTYLVQVESALTCATANRDGSAVASERLLSRDKTQLHIDIPPGQPTVEVTTYNSSALQVNLSQSATDFNEAIVFFDVFRQLGDTSEEQGLRFVNQSAGVSLVDTLDFVPGTLYSYYTFAYYKGAKSAVSPLVSQCTNPEAPSSIRVVRSSNDTIVVAWNSPNGGVTDYELSVDHDTPFTVLSVMGEAGLLEANVTVPLSGTEYGLRIRSLFNCSGDSTQKMSEWAHVIVTSRPAKPVILSATPLAGVSDGVELLIEYTDSPDSFVFYSNGEEIGTVNYDNYTFVHKGVLAGVENIYTVAAVKNGLMGDLSDPVIACSFPSVPDTAYFIEDGSDAVEIKWTIPARSATQIGVSSYDVYLDDVLESDDQTNRSFSKTGLGPMQAMTFSIATNILCDNATTEYTSAAYQGGLKTVNAYTAPIPPEPYFPSAQTATSITVALDNPGTNTWGIPYDKIRLFRFGVEVDSQSTELDPYLFTDSGLQSATEYQYEAEVTWNGLTAYSESPIAICTYPNVPRNPETSNKYWYGVDIEWEVPLGNSPDSFEIKIDVAGEDDWFDVGFVTQHSLRSSDTPDDFSVSGSSGNLAGVLTAKSGFTIKTIQASTKYIVQIRSVFACSADGNTLYGYPVSVEVNTAPYPPKEVQLEPKDINTVQITWAANQSPEVTYDIMECSLDLSDCTTAVAIDLTTDTFLISGLEASSMHCYELVARWEGMETKTRDRYLWLEDYDYQVDPTDVNYVRDNALFSEGHLTFTNYTHAYADALCTCTYPAAPTSIAWMQLNSSALYFEWAVPAAPNHDTLTSPTTGHALKLYNVAMHSGDDATQTELGYNVTSHMFDGFDPITSHLVQVKTRLVCPDRKTEMYDLEATVLDSEALGVTAWTRPTIPTISFATQQYTNPDEEIRLDFTTPDTEYLFFQLERNGSMTDLNDTTDFLIDTDLTPGTVYSYRVTSSYYDVTGIVLTSLESDYIQQCTLPSDVPTLEQTPVENSNSIMLTWTPPVDNFIGFRYTTDDWVTSTFTTDTSLTLTDLDWCDLWKFEIYSVGTCGATPEEDSEHSVSLTGAVPPEIPEILSTSDALSPTQIQVRWSDPNAARNCDPETYTMLYRDGALVYNSSNLAKTNFPDSGLSAAQVYQYQTRALRSGAFSEPSAVFTLCTQPNPIEISSLTCAATDTLKMNLSWSPPPDTDVVGYDLDIAGTISRTQTAYTSDSYEITVLYPGTEYLLDVTVAVLIDCPKTSGGTTQRSGNNPVISIACYTYPQEVFFTDINSQDTSIALAWTQEGESSYYQVTVTPVTSSGEGSPSVSNVTEPAYSTSGLDSSTQYNIVVVNYYMGNPSNPTEYIHNELPADDKLLGQSVAVGAVIIALVVLAGIAVIALIIFVAYKIAAKIQSSASTPLKRGVTHAW